jgi:hypothetical protein
LIDCEKKRRRMRDRPSDAVLAEIRRLLGQLGDPRKSGSPIPPTPPDPGPSSTSSAQEHATL